MAFKWNDLFSLGDDFDDEDLLQADWTVPSDSGTTLQTFDLQGSSTSNAVVQAIPATSITTPENESDPDRLTTHDAPGQTSVLGLRSFSATEFSSAPVARPSSSLSAVKNNIQAAGPTQQKFLNTPASGAQSQYDFDDWDVDLADLDENDPPVVPVLHAGQVPPVTSSGLVTTNSNWPCEKSMSPAKKMRPAACASGLIPPGPNLRGHSIASHTPDSLGKALAPRSSFPTPSSSPGFPRGPTVAFAPPHSPGIRRPESSCLFPTISSPVLPRLGRTQPIGLAGSTLNIPTVPRSPAPTPRAHSPQTPVLTNHLVQLVSASKKTPQRPCTDQTQPQIRLFPGPAGLMPLQFSGKNLDDIVVSIPFTPSHGAVARPRNKVSSSQAPNEEDFKGGAWAAMKAEMGLDEKNPSCFLHSYSIVKVLCKAAFKQLNKKKVPNMAVVLKSIVHVRDNALAVFKDPTGEMQGTVHRRLLEDRKAEFKAGAVLLLKQVSVFSPSQRKHHLIITANNVLQIYPPDGCLQPSTPQSQHALGGFSRTAGDPVSQMELRSEPEEEVEQVHRNSRAPEGSPEANGPLVTSEAAWDTDDLDALLGELPVETYSV